VRFEHAPPHHHRTATAALVLTRRASTAPRLAPVRVNERGFAQNGWRFDFRMAIRALHARIVSAVVFRVLKNQFRVHKNFIDGRYAADPAYVSRSPYP
jgi:hypothetical protein